MSGAIRSWTRLFLQVVVTTAMFAAVAQFADWPSHRTLPADSALVTLSFSHSARRADECRRRTAEELARLPPNMRTPLDCPRSRGPIYVELDIDGRRVFGESIRPSGLAGDGPARVHQRFHLAAGRHDIAVRMRTAQRHDGFDYEKSGSVTLNANQSFVIDFPSPAAGFSFN